jgi:hypothetical protein
MPSSETSPAASLLHGVGASVSGVYHRSSSCSYYISPLHHQVIVIDIVAASPKSTQKELRLRQKT